MYGYGALGQRTWAICETWGISTRRGQRGDEKTGRKKGEKQKTLLKRHACIISFYKGKIIYLMCVLEASPKSSSAASRNGFLSSVIQAHALPVTLVSFGLSLQPS